MNIEFLYQTIFKSLLFSLEPEIAHNFSINTANYLFKIFDNYDFIYDSPVLNTKFLNYNLKNCFGLAAGFDKNGQYINVTSKLGFGYLEIGSITKQSSIGNNQPRLFRLAADKAIINRMGLNNQGAESIVKNLQYQTYNLPIALNIANSNIGFKSNKEELADILDCFNIVRTLPSMYVAINISCPNTKHGIISSYKYLKNLLCEINRENHNCNLFLKLSSDHDTSALLEFINIAKYNNIAGFICGNTSITRKNLITNQKYIKQIGIGGLSGRPIFNKNLELLKFIAKNKLDNQLLIGCGGIFGFNDALEYLNCGANLVQLYTGLIFQGPSLIKNMCIEFEKYLNDKK